jgi:hypothetical protein
MWDDTVVGKLNSSLGFDGTDDAVGAGVQLVAGYPFTLSAWVNTTDTTGTIFSLYDTGVATYQEIGIDSGNASADSVTSGSGASALSASTVNNGAWHHVVGVFASATSRAIYVDGRLETTNTSSVTFGSGIDSWSIGIRESSNPIEAQIDDVRIYNYELTAAQIRKIKNDDAGVRFGPTEGNP